MLNSMHWWSLKVITSRTQTNRASVSRKSPMLKSELPTSIPSVRDTSWYQAEFSDHLCCSLMSNISAPLFLAICIRRYWAPFPLPVGILPAWKRTAARHMTISLASEAPGNLDILSDAAVLPPHPQATEPEQAPGARVG